MERGTIQEAGELARRRAEGGGERWTEKKKAAAGERNDRRREKQHTRKQRAWSTASGAQHASDAAK